MNEQITNIMNSIKEFWNRQTPKAKKLLISGAVLIPLIALSIALVLNNSNYTVLYSQIDSAESTEVIQMLQQNSIDYKYQSDGTILVPSDQEDKLRMQLAESGYPKKGFNYDLFTENIDFMTTDYEKKNYKIFQLQERLQASIETIDGVSKAIVTIHIPDDKGFAWETNKDEASASVKINLVNGRSLTSSQSKGIMQLICKSVSGLTEENVAIVDTEGNSIVTNSELIQTDAIKLKLQVEKEFEKDTANSVRTFLASIYGPENVQVSAKCSINFDKKISEILQYMPDEDTKKGVVSQYENDREVMGPGNTVGGVPGTDTNSEIPTYPDVNIQGEDIYFKDSNSINYVISQLKEQVQHNSGNVEDLTISVVINKDSMTAEESDSVKNLVANSTGVQLEKVALYNTKFYDAKDPYASGPDVYEPPTISKEMLIYGGIALAAFSILIFIISIILGKRRKKRRPVLATEEGSLRSDNNSGNKEDSFSWQDIKDEIQVQETQQQRMKKQVKDFTTNNPEIAAQLLRTWMKGDEE